MLKEYVPAQASVHNQPAPGSYRHCTNLKVPLDPTDLGFLAALPDYRLGPPQKGKAKTAWEADELKAKGYVGLYTTLEVLETAIASLKTVIAASVDELFSRAYIREKRATEGRLLEEETDRESQKPALKNKSKRAERMLDFDQDRDTLDDNSSTE